jgi:hypothetical protein
MAEAALLICHSQYASSYFRPGRRTIILPTHVPVEKGTALGLAGASRILEGVVFVDLVRHTTMDQVTEEEARHWGCADTDAARSMLRASHGAQLAKARGKVTVIHYTVVKKLPLAEPMWRDVKWPDAH